MTPKNRTLEGKNRTLVGVGDQKSPKKSDIIYRDVPYMYLTGFMKTILFIL